MNEPHLGSLRIDNSDANECNGGSGNLRGRQVDRQQFPLVVQSRMTTDSCINRRHHPALKPRRILDKGGKLNVFFSEVPSKYYRYAKDLGNTLINTRWRWILLSLCIANGIAWLLFALMWMAIAFLNGDKDKNERDACIVGTRHFAGYLLLSIETLTTIGFGEIYPGDCHQGWIVLTLQALTGVAIEGALVTAVYVKMSRPFTKRSDRLFSKKAVICLRESKFCLIFRLYDDNGKYWTKTKIRAYFMRKKITGEGEEMDNFMEPLKLQKWGLIMWPVDVVHVIDYLSPLWELSANNLLNDRFELLVTIRGDSITTGQPSQSQTSYASGDVLWGYRFKGCVEFDEDLSKYLVHLSSFNSTQMHATPLCSPRRYEEVKEEAEAEIFERQSV